VRKHLLYQHRLEGACGQWGDASFGEERGEGRRWSSALVPCSFVCEALTTRSAAVKLEQDVLLLA
jgi:hypothetical protein